MDEWKYEPGFSFAITHIGGDTPVAMEVGLGLKPNGTQLMFVVKTTAPKQWVALSGGEVRFLDGLLDFFEARKVYFADRGATGVLQGVIVCKKSDYDPFIRVLGGYSSLLDADRDAAEEALDELAGKMSVQASTLMRVIATFVDEASVISKMPEGFDQASAELDGEDLRNQRDRVEVAISSVLDERRALIDDLDALAM
jgi:hypothetical protein